MKSIKNINNLFWAAIVILCLAACSLDEYPRDTAHKEGIFGSETGLILYSNSFYEIFPGTYDGVYQIDDDSDVVARNNVATRFIPNGLSAITSSGWSWSNLRNINYFIENCEQSTVANKNHYLGMARFFRAYFYFNMVKRFGDVPWIDRIIEPDDVATLYAGRDDRFFVMEKILEDLDFAIANITLEADPTSQRITKNVARAFKTRVCLYEGSFRKYHTGYNMQSTANTWFQEVVNTANSITGHSLSQGTNVYREMFLQKTPYMDETILCLALDAGLALYNSRNRRTVSPTYGNRPALTRRFILTYLNADGTSYTMTNPNWATTVFVDEVQ